jgi:hypothetical protein
MNKGLFSFFALLTFVWLPLFVHAQVPQKMSYQAVIRNSNNALVANQIVGMRMSILQGSANGTAVYVETQTPVTNVNGLVSLEIGAGTVVSGTFSGIDWTAGPYFVQTETDPTGSTNYSITGTSQLLSVPYALHAKTAEVIIGVGAGTFSHYIGEVFGGGVIFHLWKDAQGVEHGLIADQTDLSASHAWSNVSGPVVWTYGLSDNMDGMINSLDIVAQPGHISSAASLCLNSTNGGFTDWYLPAIDELSMLFSNRLAINRTFANMAGASPVAFSTAYWSSTGWSNDGAISFDLFNGAGEVAYAKSMLLAVRAIRAF